MVQHMRVLRHQIAHDDSRDDLEIDRLGAAYEATRLFTRLVTALRRYQRDQNLRERDELALAEGMAFLEALRRQVLSGSRREKASVVAMSHSALPFDLDAYEEVSALVGSVDEPVRTDLANVLERAEADFRDILSHTADADTAAQFQKVFTLMSDRSFEEGQRISALGDRDRQIPLGHRHSS